MILNPRIHKIDNIFEQRVSDTRFMYYILFMHIMYFMTTPCADVSPVQSRVV